MTRCSVCLPFLRRCSPKPKTRELSGTFAIITGSSEGMGVTIAHHLAAEDVTNFAPATFGKDKLVDVAADIRQKHPGTTFLTKETDVAFCCCNILVNNAGVAGDSFNGC